ncbi:Beta-hexosaminidase 2 [Turnera subulata]|uniref:Beta-hexosaminidase n=1 Tax=Turnera subulata TaxID=218843 RepID=A0A9Q0G811_9ROSI|nr:Beta-hexosaminidase 2 [Turnera subulata]
MVGWVWKIVLVLCLVVAINSGVTVATRTTTTGNRRRRGEYLQYGLNVWPKPRSISWPHPEATLLSPSFNISSPSHPYLSPAVERYLLQILKEHYIPMFTPALNVSNSSPPLQTLAITVKDLKSPLGDGVDESYTLVIPSDNSGCGYLEAETAWGAMRGLETFSQLVWGEPSRVPVGLRVRDSPLFQHRGLMLDTSRNYYPVEDLVRTISAMSANKLNVFHWHITDSHSFPLLLPSHPDLASKGSYGPHMQYSPSDVASIVRLGLEHGVRVVPELDFPAHTGSWAGAYPEIVTCANMFWWPAETEWNDRLASEPGTGHLNPLNPKTYEVVKDVIRDVVTLFPDTFYHAGGDEIVPGCWKADPDVQSFLSNNPNATLSQLLEMFVNSTFPYIQSLNRTAVYWEDILLDQNIKVDPSFLPPANTILQTWNNGPNNTKLIVSSGYRAIVSSSDFYYLDCGHGDFLGNDSQYDQPPAAQQGDDADPPCKNNNNGGSWCGPFKTWQTVYDYDITDGLSQEEAKLVIGGEVALWSEQADPTVLDARLWPRTSAMAETLWSGNRDHTGKKRYAEAMDRLNEWRYRMVSRGVRAEPLQPLWCIKNPGMCNTVHPFL